MAVEQDLRRFCASDLREPRFTDDETRSAQSRLAASRDSVHSPGEWRDLLDYLDLSQLLDIIARHDRELAAAVGAREEDLAMLVAETRRLVPTRNRICHARPPEADDLPLTIEVVEKLGSLSSGVSLQELQDVRAELAAHPLYPMTLSIPEFWGIDALVVDNNLPPSEFADTGFIGRQRDRTNLLRLLMGPHPLITVTGEGGVGKTALAMRCLYDLVERRDLYDAIVWMSLKTNQLTVGGVRQIVGAMSTEVDILASVAQRFGATVSDLDVADLFSAVLEVLDNFTVLLVIDNLETIDRAALRPLFMEIPRRSKILVTSRIGIGEFELRYPLQPLDTGDAVRLMRATARILNSDALARRDESQLREIVEKLFRNPLAIRWFVQSYSEGRSVRDLLDRKRNLEELLEFCFQNLYTTLDDRQVKYLRTMVAIGQPLSEVQIALMAGVNDVEQLRASLDYLYASNLILRAPDPAGKADALLWTTSDFARQYILSRDSHVAAERLRLYPVYRALIQARDASHRSAAATHSAHGSSTAHPLTRPRSSVR